MRPSNIVTEAGVQTRMREWWDSIPFLTSTIVIVCGTIYFVCLLIGYDSFEEVCFLPSAIVSRFQVYRIYASIFFHGSLLHIMFNMLALVPLGSGLERIMGSIRLSYTILLLATSNAIIHLLIALVVSHNPFDPSYSSPMNECAIGFSGILFSMLVIETSLSGVQSRSVFGLFNVPAKWYAFILLALFQLLMTNVSLLGHLCGILSGFAYTYGLFNFLIPGTSFYSAIESSSWLSSCVRRPKFILCSGGNPSGYIPTHSGQSPTSSGLLPGNIWRNLSSWLPQRETSAQSGENYGFDLVRNQTIFNDTTEKFAWSPFLFVLSRYLDHVWMKWCHGSHAACRRQEVSWKGKDLGSTQSQMVPAANSESNLQSRLLDPDHSPDLSMAGSGERRSNGRSTVDNTAALPPRAASQHQDLVTFDQHIQKLVSMGFEKTQVEVALAAADGNLNVAVEILMSQQG